MIAPRTLGHLSITVAVLSHKRRHLLERVLWAISQQDYPLFEVVVVGDETCLADYDLPEAIADQVRYVHCGEANICLSRNLAIEASAGEIVAFCDDDAVPEPDWLSQLARAFAFPDVGGVGGLVRGCNGLRVEWSGGVFDRTGNEVAMRIPDEMRLFDADSQVAGNQFLGTMGANSAFRREAVLSVGGFDESFRYYLDETDMMLRLAEAGWNSAVVLSAEVHHFREPNAVRDMLRAPTDFFEIAASKAYFCRRHMLEGNLDRVLTGFRRDRIAELDPHIRTGVVRQRDRARLAAQLDEGMKAGLARQRRLPMTEHYAEHPFRPFRPLAPVPISVALVAGWGLLRQHRIREMARRLAGAGHQVSVFNFMSGVHARRVRYEGGVWLHSGGTWRLDHKQDGRRLIARRERAQAELDRIAPRRNFDLVVTPVAEGPSSVLHAAGTTLYAASPAGAVTNHAEALAVLRAALEGRAPDTGLGSAGAQVAELTIDCAPPVPCMADTA